MSLAGQGNDTSSPGFAPLVVGLPRSGFSLTASIMSEIFYQVPNKFAPKQRALRAFCKSFGTQLSHTIDRVFETHGKRGKILFNDNFRFLAGGPIWNNDELGRRAYFRKYIGVLGEGDFTLLTSHPLEILDQYEVVHSHGPFSDWIHGEPFHGYQRFASVRNPVGIINSACHSINALASEYIQKVVPDLEVEEARQQLALYKLSDLKFFDALLQPLKRGLLDQIATSGQFFVVRWEDIITEPRNTIQGIIDHLGFPVPEEKAEKIWSKIKYRNLTGAHKHNYRVGKAYVGDEREAIVNEHIDVMKAAGFDEISSHFGFGPLQYLDESKYNAFQRRLSGAIRSGTVLDPLKDRHLFDLAFNKSNVDFAGFGFRMHDWRDHTRLERSNLKDPALELAVFEASDQTVSDINDLLSILLSELTDNERHLPRFHKAASEKSASFPDIDTQRAASAVSSAALGEQ